MKHLIFASLTLLTLGALSTGCSSGGSAIKRVEYCKTGHTLADITKLSNKLEIKPGESFAPISGDYAYQGAQIYYYDVDADFKIHVSETLKSDGSLDNVTICAGGKGFTPDAKPLHLTIPFVSDLAVDASNKKMIRTKNLVLTFGRPAPGGTWLNYSFPVESRQYKDGSPENFYDGYTEVQQYLAKPNGGPLFQLISFLKATDTDQKSGKSSNIIIQTLVNLKPVLAEERKKIDDDYDKIHPTPTL